jgi:hypothetical protein
MTPHEEILAKFDEVFRRLDALGLQLAAINAQGAVNMAAIDDLTAQVTQNTSVESSAVTLIQGIAAQLAAAGTDPVALAALTAQLTSSATALAAAVAANTPAAPAAQAKRHP